MLESKVQQPNSTAYPVPGQGETSLIYEFLETKLKIGVCVCSFFDNAERLIWRPQVDGGQTSDDSEEIRIDNRLNMVKSLSANCPLGCVFVHI